jgi:hypothetical protein
MRIEPPYAYMTDVPSGEQGTAVRAIRGKQLHDKIVSEKATSGAVEGTNTNPRQQPFKFGAKTTSHPFSLAAYQGDDFENKKNNRRVKLDDSREKLASIGPKFTQDLSKPKQLSTSLFSRTRPCMTTIDTTKATASCRSAKMHYTALGFARLSPTETLGGPTIQPREATT